MIQIYDTPLRDGTQREGISLSCDDKLRIARRLDVLGVAFIEGGWPGSNPKDAEFFERGRGGRGPAGGVTAAGDPFSAASRGAPSYAPETLKAPGRGGAETLVLCDTNGG